MIPLPLSIPLKNTIYIPTNNDHGGINDQIAFGDHDTMTIYSTIHDRITYYCKEEDTPYHPETLTLKNLINNNITIVRFDFPYTLNPKRRPDI
jgi:hypothetical protein